MTNKSNYNPRQAYLNKLAETDTKYHIDCHSCGGKGVRTSKSQVRNQQSYTYKCRECYGTGKQVNQLAQWHDVIMNVPL